MDRSGGIPLLALVLAAFFPWGNGHGTSPRVDLVWPTPNPAYRDNLPPLEFIQPTVSGRIESGLFGCVRNDGRRFHEGVDLKPIARDRRGEALDPVFAVTDGLVGHVNRVAGNSGYGIYVVLEHPRAVPPFYTLYAHLASVDPAIEEGSSVSRGQTLGVMGRSAGGYHIPRERAHLHFELGLRVSDDFDDWYSWRRYSTPNHHGVFNGLNLIGIDPLQFYDRYRIGLVHGFQDYLDLEPVAFTLRVHTETIPDFIRRYPSLLLAEPPADGLSGWEVDFTWYGLPFRWLPLPRGDGDGSGGESGRVEILFHDAELLSENSCRQTLSIRGRGAALGAHTERILQLLFGFRP